jgi:hypothetical protein
MDIIRMRPLRPRNPRLWCAEHQSTAGNLGTLHPRGVAWRDRDLGFGRMRRPQGTRSAPHWGHLGGRSGAHFAFQSLAPSLCRRVCES